MLAVQEWLRVTEAAVVSGVGVRDVNRAVDEGILAGGRQEGRRFSTLDCVEIAFYFGAAQQLTADERLFAIESLRPRLRDNDMSFFDPGTDWIVRDSFLSIDMRPFLLATNERLDRLAAARAAVESAPDILGGSPVIKGTRVPVHDVGARIAAGETASSLVEDYPHLTPEQIESASIYAEAYPLRGRPRRVSVPPGARLVHRARSPVPGKAK